MPVRRTQVIKAIPQIVQKGLRGGVAYYDGQFDDSRLAVNLMQTSIEQGATLVNYATVTSLLKNDGKVSGVVVRDETDGHTFNLKGQCIVNATGIFVDQIIQMDNREETPIVRPSQGIHLVVDRSFLGGDDAFMIPKTSDGRVLFGIPWRNRLILGTTDTPVNECVQEPRPLQEEIDFVMETSAAYLTRPLQREDVLCVYAGLRPLAAPKRNKDKKKTKEISRRHKLFVSTSGLITITGGKWTTYRQMAQETVDLCIKKCGFPPRKCVTKNLKIHGYKQTADYGNQRHVYGSDEEKIRALQNEKPEYAEKLHPSYDFTVAEVVWAVREEMAVTVDDVLSRRVRALILDARAAMVMAPVVARIMARELDRNKEWEAYQVAEFKQLASGYII